MEKGTEKWSKLWVVRERYGSKSSKSSGKV